MTGSGTTRTASLLTTAAVLAGLGLFSVAVGSLRAPLLAGLGGAVLGVAVLLRAPETPAAAMASAILMPFVALLGAGSLGVAALDSGAVALLSAGVDAGRLARAVGAVVLHVGVTTAAGIATFGATGTFRDGLGDGAVGRVWKTGVGTALLVGGVLCGLLATRFDALSRLDLPRVPVDALLGPVLSPTSSAVALLTLGLLVVAASVTASRALVVLPVVELTPRRHRDSVGELRELCRSALRWAFRAGVVVGVVGPGLALAGVLPRLVGAVPGGRSLLALAFVSRPRSLLLAVALGYGVVLAATGLLQRVTGGAAATVRELLPTGAGALAVVMTALLASGPVGRLPSMLPSTLRPGARDLLGALSATGLSLAGLELVLVGLVGVLGVLVAAGGVGYLPSRAAGGAVAAVGLVVGAVAVAVAGGTPPVVFAGVGFAVLAWDASEHGVTTRNELGASAGTPVEVVHGLGSLGVAATGVALAWFFRARLVGRFAPDGGTVVGTLAVVVALLVVLAVIRG